MLQLDPVAAIYVYHQLFPQAGQLLTRRGFMCRVRLQRFGQGTIYPHEETHSAAKQDRLHLLRATRANLSQVFGLYPDPAGQCQQLLEEAVADQAPVEATDHLGVVNRLWPVSDIKRIADLAGLMNPRPLFIADGHHRYETACDFRDELQTAGAIGPNHAAHYVLMTCVATSDPGLTVLPTHRLFRGLPPIHALDLAQRLAGLFSTTMAGQGPSGATSVWQRIARENDQGTIGLYAGADQQWMLARINQAGQDRMAQLAPEHSPDWHALGVSILHRLIIESLLDAADLPKPMYVHSVEEVVQFLQAGDLTGRDATGQQGSGGDFPLAALVMPAQVPHVQTISQHAERMPAKSTFFYPKLLSGLVINPLE